MSSGTAPLEDAASELAALASQARLWAELDSLMGERWTFVPSFAAPEPRAAVRAVEPERVRKTAPAVTAAPVARAPGAADLDSIRGANAEKLAELAKRLEGCTRCALSRGRTKIVMGQGDAASELVFVGEGPGETEDRTGLAFVGKAGELLTRMILAMGLRREDVFIANVVKCRPPGNRPPLPDEMATCLPFLEQQLDIVKPKVICALGKTAAVGLGLVKPLASLGSARGRFHSWRGIPVMVTFHPSYLLRSPQEKRKAWEDLQKIFPYLTRRAPGPLKEGAGDPG